MGLQGRHGHSCGATDKPNVSLGAASEGGGYGFSVGLDFLFEFDETCVRWVAVYLRQRWMLEISLPVVGVVGFRHVVCSQSTWGSPI
jgi:hypothetical protein